MRHIFKYLLVAFISFTSLMPGVVKAQVGIHSEADQIKMAQKHFDNKEYPIALPLYSQIVSNHPDNVMYNYYLGVCLLKVDGDKADAVRFLTIATKSTDVPYNAWLYLGMAQHQAYRFDEAIHTLQTYRKSAGKQAWRESGGESLIMMCQNAINLNNDLSLMRHSILKEQEMNVTDFVTGYKNSSQTGRFLKLPKEYETKQAKDKPESAFIFLAANGNEMVYAAPGKTGETGFDIYIVKKDSKGLWKFPEPISSEINTVGDDAFPILVNNGTTLYFSSKGHQSTGGYDVFRSDYLAETGNWSVPVPMGSPVNSPGDDFYYVPVSDNKSAYFSSDRESTSGKCKVYTASVIDDTRNFVTINGTFVCPAGLDLSDAKVTILNGEDRSLLAQFRTATLNGNYFLKLPAPSKLIYEVKIPGFGNLESEVIFTATTPVKMIQEILVKRDDKGKETIKITTREIESATPLMVESTGQSADADSFKNAVSVTTKSASDEKNEEMPLISVVATSSAEAPASTEKKDKETTTGGANNSSVENEVSSNVPSNTAAATANPETESSNKIAEKSVETNTTELVSVIPASKTTESIESNKNESAIAAVSAKESDKAEKTLPAISDKTTPVKSDIQTASEPLVSMGVTETKTGNETPIAFTETTTNPSVTPQTEVLPEKQELPLVTVTTSTTVTAPSEKKETLSNKKEKKKKSKEISEPAPVIVPAETVAEVIPAVQSSPKRPTLQDVKFKVQLGAFKNRTETDLKKKFETTGLTNLEYIKNTEGLLIVVAGNETDYDSATRLKEEAVKKGIPDAFVVVYSGENRLPVSMVVFEEE